MVSLYRIGLVSSCWYYLPLSSKLTPTWSLNLDVLFKITQTWSWKLHVLFKIILPWSLKSLPFNITVVKSNWQISCSNFNDNLPVKHLFLYMITILFVLFYSPHGHYFASCGHDRTARLWSMDHPQPLRVYSGHLSDVDVSIHYVLASSCLISLQFTKNLYPYSSLIWLLLAMYWNGKWFGSNYNWILCLTGMSVRS